MKYYDAFKEGSTSFWDEFPIFKTLNPFKATYQKDRSKDKNRSSKSMWYMVLCYDVDSEFYSLDAEDQKVKVEEVLELDVPTYLGDAFAETCAEYINLTDTVISSNIRELEMKLNERRTFISKTSYTLDDWVTPEWEAEDGTTKYGKAQLKKGTAAQLDKMIATTGPIHKQIIELREDLKQEASSESQGDQQDSLMEST